VEQFWHWVQVAREHWGTVGLALTWGGIGLVWLRRRLDWRAKQFLSQVNFSLNYVGPDGRLAMRTLLETSAAEVWLNDHGVRLVGAAARKTTPEQPFIDLSDPADRDFVNRAVLNVLSEKFADAYLAASLGLPVRSGIFRFAITCERYEEMRTLKLRVLLVEEGTLAARFGPDAPAETLTPNPVHAVRVRTLQALHQRLLKEKASGQEGLGRVELAVPVSG
jgi:hypothetical protein